MENPIRTLITSIDGYVIMGAIAAIYFLRRKQVKQTFPETFSIISATENEEIWLKLLWSVDIDSIFKYFCSNFENSDILCRYSGSARPLNLLNFLLPIDFRLHALCISKYNVLGIRVLKNYNHKTLISVWLQDDLQIDLTHTAVI